MTSKDQTNLWLHFEDIGNAVAKCKVCHKEYSFRTSLANLQTHLQRQHKDSSSTKPHKLFVTSTTLTTDDLLSDSSAIKSQGTISDNSDTDEQNNNTANNTESSDVERCPPGTIVSLLDEVAKDTPTRIARLSRRRMKRPSLRGPIRINTDEDFGRLISKKMKMLPFAIRCGLEVEILRLVNSAQNKMGELKCSHIATLGVYLKISLIIIK